MLWGSFCICVRVCPRFNVFLSYLVYFFCLNTKSVELYKEFAYYVNGMAMPLGANWPNHMHKTNYRMISNFGICFGPVRVLFDIF